MCAVQPSCTDSELGNLLSQYETGNLEEPLRDRFEKHVLECSFCANELKAMLPVARAIHSHRGSLATSMQREGLTFDNLRAELLSEAARNRSRRSLASRVNRGIRWLLERVGRPVIWVPAAAAAGAVALLFLLLGRGPAPNPYVPILAFEKLPYETVNVRALQSVQAQKYYDHAVRAYAASDFHGAAEFLGRAVKIEDGIGQWWVLLGVSHYLDRNAKGAVEALTRAQAITQYDVKTTAQWYLAQALLLDGRAQSADSLLRLISAQKQLHSAKADSLLVKLKSVRKQR